MLVILFAGGPKSYKNVFFLFLTAFSGGLYYFFLTLLNPVLAAETLLPILLTPVLCAASGVDKKYENIRPAAAFPALIKGPLGVFVVTVGLALIREPLSYLSLSVPGGDGGIMEFLGGEGDAVAMIFGTSAGALLILGYLAALVNFFKKKGEK
jgi:hypothetical protein